ncbi:hypothetical protein [Novacetimonas maltaceti]|nr:hypothetical protein [Novacetimonas maltaceti]
MLVEVQFANGDPLRQDIEHETQDDLILALAANVLTLPEVVAGHDLR